MGMSNYLKNLCFNKNKTEIIVEDDNKELSDVRKISVPDLKQYLIKGYEEIRKVKQEKEQLENDLEDDKEHLVIEQRQAVHIVLELISKLQKENEKQEKVIDEMAKKLNQHGFFSVEPVKKYDINSELYIKANTIEEIKQYFYRKVENDNEL